MTKKFGETQARRPNQLNDEGLFHLRNSRDNALQAAREAVRDTTRLTRLITILNDPGPLAYILDRSLSTLSELFLADIVILLDPVGTGSFSPLSAIGLPENIIGIPFSDDANSFVRRLLHDGEPILSENVETDDKVIDKHLLDLGVKTIVWLPVNDNHSIRGALILARCRPEPFSYLDVGLLKTMAYRIGRTLIESQRGIQSDKIVQSSREINRYLDFQKITTEALHTFPEIVSADASALVLKSEDSNLYCAGQKGLFDDCFSTILKFAEHLLTCSSLKEGEPYIRDNISEELTSISLTCQNNPPVKAVLAVPLHSKNEIQGVLFAFRFSAIACNFISSQIASLYAEQLSAALENANLYQKVHRELNERKRLEKEQRQWERQQQQIQKANSLSSMAGGIAHHFNNQLGVVIGNLELALDDLPGNSEITENLFAAMKGALKAAEVSELMLTYLGQTYSSTTQLDITELCHKSMPLLQAAAPIGMQLKISAPAPAITANANANQIQQVLTNLVTNAYEACQEQQGVVEISVTSLSADDIPDKNRFPVEWYPQDSHYACIGVSDNGTGLATDDIDKIFDPFFSSKFAGRGLGLPVVLGVAKGHNGAIVVQTSAKGSNFTVYLPQSEEHFHKKEDSPNRHFSNLAGQTILLVEDEHLVRKVAASMLESLGFKVITAQDGDEAVEIFTKQQKNIDAVLCDLSMPRMDGWQTLKALRKMAPEIPVVLSSGHDEYSATLSGSNPLRDEIFLHKPYQKKELKHALSCALISP